MVIKRKDGTTYRLRGPNPIMVRQALWENDKAIVYNIDPPEIVTKQDHIQEQEIVEKEPIPDISLEDLPVEELKVPVIEVEKSKLPPGAIKKKQPIPQEIPKELVYVLPALIKDNYDPLYGETRSQMTFGGKFTMEIVIVNQNDLQVVLWSNNLSAGLGSIVYIPSQKRWWKVNNAYDKGEGHVMVCGPSSLQPSFD